jgi:hypothetical protein
MPRRFGRLTADPENVLTDAGNADLDNVNGVWQQLVNDFPFLARTVTGSARDLGPYERSVSTTGIAPSALSKDSTGGQQKFFRDGRLVIQKNGQDYNVMGQKL